MSAYDSKFVMIHQDEAAQSVVVQWRRPAQYQTFKDGLEATLAEVAQSKVHRVLADHSMLNLQDQDEAFFLKQWIPQAARSGVQRLAVVVDRRRYVQIPKTRLVQRLKSRNLTLHYFAEMDEARIWVREQAAA